MPRKIIIVRTERRKKMTRSIIAFILSAGLGIFLSFFNQGMGIVIAISIMGAFIIYSINTKQK